MHRNITGASGLGKTTAEARRVAEFDGAVVEVDPHGSTDEPGEGSLFVKTLPHLKGDILIDDYSRTDRFIQLRWLEASTADDPATRLMENESRIRRFVETLFRRRDLEPHKAVLNEEWAMANGWLYLEQPLPLPERVLPFGFMPRHPVFNELVENCTNSEIAWKFKELKSMSPYQLRSEVGAALRLTNAVCRSPAFLLRSNGRFDLPTLLDRKGKFLICWGKKASWDACRVMSGAIIQQVFQYVRTRPRPYPKVLLVIDEAVNAGLIGLNEIMALAETRKMGLEVDLIAQDHSGLEPEIASGLQTNTEHHYFRPGSLMMAELAAKDLGIPLYDPHKVHSVEERIRELSDGYDYEVSQSRRLGDRDHDDVITESIQARPRRKQIIDRTTKYLSGSDQILGTQRDVMSLGVGECGIRDADGVRFVKIEQLQEKWPWPGLASKKLQQKIAEIYQRPEYSTGMGGMNAYVPVSTSTPARQNNSRTSSPAKRLRTGESGRSENNGKSGT